MPGVGVRGAAVQHQRRSPIRRNDAPAAQGLPGQRRTDQCHTETVGCCIKHEVIVLESAIPGSGR